MQECWSFTCCFSWTCGSSSKSSQLKVFLHLFFFRCFENLLRCSTELVQLVPLLYSGRRSIHYLDKLYGFSTIIPRCYMDVYVDSFSPGTAKLRISPPIECFPFTYHLNNLKSRINRYLLTVGSFWADLMLFQSF